MNTEKSKENIAKILQNPFEREAFLFLVRNLLKNIERKPNSHEPSRTVKDNSHLIQSCEIIGKFRDVEGKWATVIIVRVRERLSSGDYFSELENFISRHMSDFSNAGEKSFLIAACLQPGGDVWKLAFIEFCHELNEKIEIDCFCWYSAGKDESSYASQKFLSFLLKARKSLTFDDLKSAFNGVRIRKDFLEKFRNLYVQLEDSVKGQLKKHPESLKISNNEVSDFVISLLVHILFSLILQKAEYFENCDLSGGNRKFLRNLFEDAQKENKNYYSDILFPALTGIYPIDALNGKGSKCILTSSLLDFCLHRHQDFESSLYKDMRIPNEIFSNVNMTRDGFIGDGILDVFERYNYKLREDKINEISMSITPGMIGRAFESIRGLKKRKKSGTFYTPEAIVMYMCREALKRHISSEMNGKVMPEDIEELIQWSEHLSKNRMKVQKDKRFQVGFMNCKLPDSVIKMAGEIDEILTRIRVCDPAVGSGVFALGMLNLIVCIRHFLTPYLFPDKNNNAFDCSEDERNLYYLTKHTIENCVYGVDIDNRSVEMTKIQLSLSLAGSLDVSIVRQKSENRIFDEFREIDFKIKMGNSLLSGGEYSNGQMKPFEFNFHSQFPQVFCEKNGFDIVIGNPPYIGEKGNKEIFWTVKNGEFGEFYAGKMDYFYFFFHLALNIAREKGIVAFITTDYFPTATGAKKLRSDLKNRAIVRSLVDLGDLKVFDSAKGQHNMITLLEKGRDEEAFAYVSKTRKKGFVKPRILMKILKGQDSETLYCEVKQKKLYDGNECYIRINPKGFSGIKEELVRDILQKIEADSVGLDLICNIKQGIVTGADKVSKKHIDRYGIKAKRGDGIFVLSDEEISGLKLDEDEKDVLKPWFKNSAIFRWHTEQFSSDRVIYADKKKDNLNSEKIRRHLEKYKKIIDDSSSNSPYLHRPRDIDFESEKIVAPQRSQINTFGYNKIPWYASADVYFITEKDGSMPLKYLLALLNSKLYYLWLCSKGKRKGGNLELYQKPLSEIPVKRTSKKETISVVSVVDKILQATVSKNSAENFSLVHEFEHEIDFLIYRIYGLSSDEIKSIQSINRPNII